METLSGAVHYPSKPQPAMVGTSGDHTVGSAGFQERRRHARGRIGGPHTVLINEKNAALVANLSEGGMRVQALGRRVDPGANLRLQLQLPGSQEPIQLSGVVAWVSELAEAGIRFREPTKPLVQRLREWLAKNEVLNAAREFMKIAGGWRAALELMSELTRILTDASHAAVTLTASARPLPSTVADPQPVRATVAAPIYASERIIGHLEISSTELGAFDEQDLELLRTLAAIGSEMTELRAASARQPAQKPSPLPARIASRIEGMFPAVRLRFVP